MLLWLHRLGPIYCLGIIVYILYSINIYPNSLTFYFLLIPILLNGYFCYVKGVGMGIRNALFNFECNIEQIAKEEGQKIAEQIIKEFEEKEEMRQKQEQNNSLN